jgi:hypothetical protein
MFENRADIQPFLAETQRGRFAAEIPAARLAGRCCVGVLDAPAWTMLLQADMASLGTNC